MSRRKGPRGAWIDLPVPGQPVEHMVGAFGPVDLDRVDGVAKGTLTASSFRDAPSWNRAPIKPNQGGGSVPCSVPQCRRRASPKTRICRVHAAGVPA